MSSRRGLPLARSIVDRGLPLALIAASLGACRSGPTPAQMFYAQNFDGAASVLEEPAQEPGKDRLLHHHEYAMSLLELGRREAARAAFVDSWTSQQSNEGSWIRGLMALWGGEASKVYRGDPYERAMVSIYAGLLLYQAGDYQNARAAFKNASLEDSGSGDDSYNADFAISYLFEGLCARRQGYEDEARALFEQASRSRAGQRSTPFLRTLDEWDPNLIVVVGVGRAPIKSAVGMFDEMSIFEQVPTPENYAMVTVDGELVGRTHEIENLFYQAQTRGGRYMDDLLRTKATVKKTLRTAAVIFLWGALIASMGAVAASNQGGSNSNDAATLLAGAAAVLLAAAGAAYLLSWAITPEADTRHWQTLPGSLQILMCQAPPGQRRLKLDFFDASGEPIQGLSREVKDVPIQDGDSRLVLVRSIAPGLYPDKNATYPKVENAGGEK